MWKLKQQKEEVKQVSARGGIFLVRWMVNRNMILEAG
jgi:hypothetical protein